MYMYFNICMHMYMHVTIKHLTYIAVADTAVLQSSESIMLKCPDIILIVHYTIIHLSAIAHTIISVGGVIRRSTSNPSGFKSSNTLLQNRHFLLECKHFFHHSQVLATTWTH